MAIRSLCSGVWSFLGVFLETPQVSRSRWNVCYSFFPLFSFPQIYYIVSLLIGFSMLLPFHRIDSLVYSFLINS